MAKMTVSIEPEIRLCEVHHCTAYFHCWERYSHNGESQVYGIIETTDGMERVEPTELNLLMKRAVYFMK